MHDHAVQIDAHDGVDGVDQRDRIRTAALGGTCGQAHVGDVGRELHDHRHLGVVLAPLGHHLDVFRNLADRRAHAAFAHAVRAAEVEFDAIGTHVLDHRQDALPAFFHAGHHQRDDHRAVGPVAFDAANLFEVLRQRAIGDQLDVVQADHAAVLGHQRGVARAIHVDDWWIFAECFPDHATPARFEGARDVDLFVGGRSRGEPERVGALDAKEITADIGHGVSPDSGSAGSADSTG